MHIKLYLLKYLIEKYSIYLHKYICTKTFSLPEHMLKVTLINT